MDSFIAIIDEFGGPGPFSEAVGIPDSHARAMKARDAISDGWWTTIISAAERLGKPGITLERLAAIAASRNPKLQPASIAEPQETAA